MLTDQSAVVLDQSSQIKMLQDQVEEEMRGRERVEDELGLWEERFGELGYAVGKMMKLERRMREELKEVQSSLSSHHIIQEIQNEEQQQEEDSSFDSQGREEDEISELKNRYKKMKIHWESTLSFIKLLIWLSINYSIHHHGLFPCVL